MAVFFSSLAPGARIRGSRDPLGLLPVWSRIGRRLVANVTTVCGDLRGWTTLLVAVGLTERLVASGHLEPEDPGPLREAFFRAEQLIGYAAIVCDIGTIPRGVQGMRRQLAEHDEGAEALILGTSREQAILASQGSAGVWGQVLASARASGLVERRQLALTPSARLVWESTWWPRLAPHARVVQQILLGVRGFAPRGHDQPLALAVAGLVGPALLAGEVDLVRDHILYADRGEEGLQAGLVDGWRRRGMEESLDLAGLLDLGARLEGKGHADIAVLLRDTLAVEHLLGPCDLLYRWLLGQHQRLLDDVLEELAKRWAEPLTWSAGATDALLTPPARAAYPTIPMPDLLGSLRESLASASWRDAVNAAIELNRAVMKARGGAPWITLEAGRLHVVYADDRASLPTAESTRERLVHSYYLDPLRRLVHAWERGHDDR